MREIVSKCKHRQSHFDFLNNAYWVSLFQGNNLLAKICFTLIRSKLSITGYLFLVLYRSTSLQSLSFLKNMKTFLCKQKLVNNCSIPSNEQPYNHDSFSKILRASTALQSQSFLKNIENFLCKQKIVNNHSIPSTARKKITYLSD